MASVSLPRSAFALLTVGGLLLMLALAAPAALAAGKWGLYSEANTSVAPGGSFQFAFGAANEGDHVMIDGSLDPVTIAVSLPPGFSVGDPISATDRQVFTRYGNSNIWPCTRMDGSPLETGDAEFKCENTALIPSALGFENASPPTNSSTLSFVVNVAPDAAEGVAMTKFEVSGGGFLPATRLDPTRVTSEPPSFGVAAFDAGLSKADGSAHTRAAAPPYEAHFEIDLNTQTKPGPSGQRYPVEATRQASSELPPGLVGNPTAVGECNASQLANGEAFSANPLCPAGSQVGTVHIQFNSREGTNGATVRPIEGPLPLYNMDPPPGIPQRLGFSLLGTSVLVDTELRTNDDYRLTSTSYNITQALGTSAYHFNVWGVPADPAHDRLRNCPGESMENYGFRATDPECDIGYERPDAPPFLRAPTSCGPMEFDVHAASWENFGRSNADGTPDLSDPAWESASAVSHEAPGYPLPPAQWGPVAPIEECDVVQLVPELSLAPTAHAAETSTGLSVRLEIPNPGLENPAGVADADLKKAVVSLPEGVTVNPSSAEGLGVCAPAQYAKETLTSEFGQGCPGESKIGSLRIDTQLLEEPIEGNLYLGQQDDLTTSARGAENPFDSLLALYVVAKNEESGILIKLPGKVETDERTGRIVTTFDDLPQLPFSAFTLRFREGARGVLVTPNACGTYTTEAQFTPWSAADPDNPTPAETVETRSPFVIDRGIGDGPCPPGGIPSFKPGFSAGTLNNNAGAFSPFSLSLTRSDGEQDLTKFNSVLPPGVSAKIAGVQKCTEAQIAAARAIGRTGRQELASPSCSAGSEIGRSLAGAGVGSVLTYVPGKIYLAGPWNGAPLSVVAITPAVAGPFDVGVVVVRQALTLDPVTAEVHVDGEKSDPIPHILEGIPLKVRDLRVYVDRPDFTINPTSCDPSQVAATLFGSYADVFNPADDRPVALSSRFQAANCSSLGFKPKLTINLEGGNRRGGHPGLKAVFKPRPGDANLARTVVKLPRSAFLDQAHIRTICTRVQFAADACPPAAVYGKVTAFSPLLDEPLKGPAFLRSSDNKLPDLVFDLHGVVDIETSARIDSVRGGIRATFPFVPDAPLTKVVVEMQGGKKGLIVNSRNLCARPSRAELKLDGHNGKVSDSRPLVRPDCQKKHKRRS